MDVCMDTDIMLTEAVSPEVRLRWDGVENPKMREL
jgi:hypothetical protein